MAGSFVVESKMDDRYSSAFWQWPGLSAFFVGFFVVVAGLLKEVLEPRNQVYCWILFCVVIPLIFYLRGMNL